jgi:hypothetical protein
LVARSLETDARVREDRKRLAQILKIDPEDLCREQSQCRS